jgi:hypothetical protein
MSATQQLIDTPLPPLSPATIRAATACVYRNCPGDADTVLAALGLS